MRTLLVSDLHLGTRSRADILRDPGAPRAALLEALRDVDRLVLLGDTLELRHGPARGVLDAARPALAELGVALAGREVVVLAGNHDHALLRRRCELGEPLGLQARCMPAEASGLAERLADALAPARVDFAYPGLRVREDVYALHGHYLDRHITMPTFERLAAGAMGRVVGPVPAQGASAEDYEAALAPVYAWIHALAQGTAPDVMARSAGSSARVWGALNGDGPRSLRTRALGFALPGLVAGLNRVGFGPLGADVSGAELRRAGLRALAEVAVRLRVDAEHVIFGHTHRSGPHRGDDLGEWIAPGGTRLHNTGSWTFARHFVADAGSASPYWPGTAVLVGESGPPELLSLLADVPAAELAPAPPRGARALKRARA